MKPWPPGTEVIVGPFIVVASIWLFGGRLIRALQATNPGRIGPLVEWWDSRSARARSSMTLGAVIFSVSIGVLVTASGNLSRQGEILALVVMTGGAAQLAYGLTLAR